MEQAQLGGDLLESAAAWRAFLVTADDTYLRVIPGPGIFSPLQYGAHVRDIQRVYGDRILLMLHEDSPVFPQFNPDEGEWDAFNRLGARTWPTGSGRKRNGWREFSLISNPKTGRAP